MCMYTCMYVHILYYGLTDYQMIIHNFFISRISVFCILNK